jgi:hypothetical protein
LRKKVFNLENQDLTMHPNCQNAPSGRPRVHCIKTVVSIQVAADVASFAAIFLFLEKRSSLARSVTAPFPQAIPPAAP